MGLCPLPPGTPPPPSLRVFSLLTGLPIPNLEALNPELIFPK